MSFGGRYVPESLVPACEELATGSGKPGPTRRSGPSWTGCCAVYAGRPTALTPAWRLSAELGVTLLLKREDLAHTGSHKINNVLGQALLARRMGKTRLLAETGAGQHGVATATAAALLGLRATVFMGERDIERQELNVFRMRMLGAEVVPVTQRQPHPQGRRHRGDAALGRRGRRQHYCLGSVVGPHPYPWMVREFQRVIGDEARAPVRRRAAGRCPDYVVACVGGGSNAAGTFAGFVDTPARLVGVEAAGGAALTEGGPACCTGPSLVLQDEHGQVARGALDRRRPGLPGRRPGARPPARPRPGPVRHGHRRGGARRGAPAGPHRGHPGRAGVGARGRLGAARPPAPPTAEPGRPCC